MQRSRSPQPSMSRETKVRRQHAVTHPRPCAELWQGSLCGKPRVGGLLTLMSTGSDFCRCQANGFQTRSHVHIVVQAMYGVTWQSHDDHIPIVTDAAVSFDSDAETVTLEFPSELPSGSGEVVLAIQYTGILNDQMRGFYSSKYTHPDHPGEERYAAVTQFEVGFWLVTIHKGFIAQVTSHCLAVCLLCFAVWRISLAWEGMIQQHRHSTQCMQQVLSWYLSLRSPFPFLSTLGESCCSLAERVAPSNVDTWHRSLAFCLILVFAIGCRIRPVKGAVSSCIYQ